MHLHQIVILNYEPLDLERQLFVPKIEDICTHYHFYKEIRVTHKCIYWLYTNAQRGTVVSSIFMGINFCGLR